MSKDWVVPTSLAETPFQNKVRPRAANKSRNGLIANKKTTKRSMEQ